jgi:hypothetical protein
MLMRGNFCGKCFILIMAMSLAGMSLSIFVDDACAQILAILLVYVSILACCSALLIFEKHMLVFVDLIHALPTRGEESTQFMFPWGGVLHHGKKNLGEMHLFSGILHSCIWELFFA